MTEQLYMECLKQLIDEEIDKLIGCGELKNELMAVKGVREEKKE